MENGLVLWLFWPKRHVCMIVDWYYTSLNSILVYYQGSWSPGWESKMNFYSNLATFYPTNPNFGGEPTSFVAALAQNTCVHGCRLVLYDLNFNTISILRFTRPQREIIDEFVLQTHHFLPKPSPYLRKIDLFFLLFWLKTHVCALIDRWYAVSKSSFVY